MEACSLSKEISTCDNHSGETPRCLVEDEVSKVQLFTSSATGNVAKNRVINCDIVYSVAHSGKRFSIVRI